MTQTAVQRFYRFHAYVYDFTRWMILHGRARAVAMLRLRPDSAVLEIGCGTGLNFRHVLQYLDPSCGRLTGLDFSADMLERARRRVARHDWRCVELVQDDASTFSRDQRYDAILFAYSLTMIPDWPGALRRAREHLRPGGRVAVLDFGMFSGWGPLKPVMRGWLKLNHVQTHESYVEEMRKVFGNVRVQHWLGGYNFTAISENAGAGPGH
ncbi:MAG: Ubiquinone/menaquinone biosynthesis C-methyltransferase UbiE [Phycisphaerae bacterium]|nr:Ubiquinone/menaquinone biosynthesis C-methyltransferase UbiE [Phycisphaerae bacterium]